jgi:hypothetical protein
MKLLLDQGLPRSTVTQLSNTGIEAVHVGEIDWTIERALPRVAGTFLLGCEIRKWELENRKEVGVSGRFLCDVRREERE